MFQPNGKEHLYEVLWTSVSPWATFLPSRDRDLFVHELTQSLHGVSLIDDFAPVGQFLREWKATAEIHADPRLARRLRSGLDASSDAIPTP